MPAVYVEPENKGRYQQVLALCRQVAANRQATAAQMAQLESLTGVVEGAGTGAAAGLVFGAGQRWIRYWRPRKCGDRRRGRRAQCSGKRLCERRERDRFGDAKNSFELPEKDVERGDTLAGVRVSRAAIAVTARRIEPLGVV